jgi:tellurite resistance-related uncharacterized protein
MACTLSTGRNLSCNDTVGGIKSVYFCEYGTMGALTVTSGEVTAFGGTPDFYEFEVRGGVSSLEQTITGSRENGTVFYEQAVNLTLQKLDLATQEEIVKIAKARPHVVIETHNTRGDTTEKVYLMVGAVHGADVTGGTIVTGATMGDLTGFTLTLSGQETLPAYFVDGTVFEALVDSTKITP